MAFSLGSLNLGNLTAALPSGDEIANQVVTGALATVVLSGLKSQSGLDAVDPLHIIHKDGSASVVGTKTMPIASFNQLDAAGKQAVLAAGIVPA